MIDSIVIFKCIEESIDNNLWSNCFKHGWDTQSSIHAVTSEFFKCLFNGMHVRRGMRDCGIKMERVRTKVALGLSRHSIKCVLLIWHKDHFDHKNIFRNI